MAKRKGTVDVSRKPATLRRAVAESTLSASADAVAAIRDNALPKADPLPTARAAGMLAAKGTPSLIPHCHPIAITGIAFDFEFTETAVTVRCEVTANDRTGPEMEALVGAAAATLTLYDMIKGTTRGARIVETRLLEKEGGKSGHWRAPGGADG